MAITIEPTEANSYTINGKEVYKDASGNWIARNACKFTTAELRAWSNYKKLVIDGNRKNITLKTYA